MWFTGGINTSNTFSPRSAGYDPVIDQGKNGVHIAYSGGGGPAIIDVLDGSYNPTAKLPYTIYPAAFNLTRPITVRTASCTIIDH